MIKEHVNPVYKIIVVGSRNNRVVSFLQENNYNYTCFDEQLNGREINALYNLIQTLGCKQTFISNFNYKKLNGSTFSYYISLLSQPKKIVSIDIDNIYSNPVIYNN